MNLTKEQIEEVYTRLKEYAGWMYYSEKGAEQFAKTIIEHNGKKFSIDIGENDGLYYMREHESGKTAIIEVIFKTEQAKYGIDNVGHTFKILNHEEMGEEWTKIFQEIGIFTFSTFQRTIALTWIARMEEVTVSKIIKILLSLNDKDFAIVKQQ